MDREIKRRKWGAKRIAVLAGSAALISAVVWSLAKDGLKITLPDAKPCDHAFVFRIEK